MESISISGVHPEVCYGKRQAFRMQLLVEINVLKYVSLR
jgi:hypothetical protein